MTGRTLSSSIVGMAREIIRTRRQKDRPYYDAQADGRARDAYYAGIGLEGSSKEIFDELHELVKATHDTGLTYKVARLHHLYPWIDLQPNTLALHSIYSGEEMQVEDVMLYDLQAMAEARPQLRAYVHLSDLAAFLADTADEDAEYDPQSMGFSGRYNCEHVVPQSWFDKRQPMRADLHHLFTCEPRCNSYRGNLAYFDFLPTLDAEMNDCGRRSTAKFEPARNHGVVARATLYFLLRYPEEIGDLGGEMGPERLEMMIRWHEVEGPGLYEQHRNAEIMAVQGNRNPLIDFPELARRIDFKKGLTLCRK